MFGQISQAITFCCTFLVLFVAHTDSLWCRNGVENRYSSQEWSMKCDYGETACFQSVKCITSGGTRYRDYEWRCIDGSKCSNATGTSTAYYLNAKGTCCFTDNCNANHGPCTDAGISLNNARWLPIALTTVLVYFLVRV